MTTKQWFERGRTAAYELRSLREARDVAFAACTSATVSTDRSQVQSGGAGRDLASSEALKYYELVDKYDAKIQEAIDVWTEIENRISEIDNERYRVVLRERYIIAKSWTAIADLLHYDLKYVFDLHGKALLSAEKKKNRLNLE